MPKQRAARVGAAPIAPASFARGYLRFLEFNQHTGAERFLDTERLATFQRVLGWLARQETMEERRFLHILRQRAAESDEPHVRWVCAHTARIWNIRQLRVAYGNTWSQASAGSIASAAPWDVVAEA
jgi:hypothetical protein